MFIRMGHSLFPECPILFILARCSDCDEWKLREPDWRRQLMKRLSCCWFAFLVLLFCVSAPAFAQGSHTLQGKVISPSGSAPVQPVKVTLTLSGRRIYETFTDLAGNFSFSSLR